MNAVIAWLLTFMVAVAPTNRRQFYPDAQETQQEAEARYNSIASDIVSVVYNRDNPPLFNGPDGRSRSASVVMGIMMHESGFRRDVDYGIGRYGRGDGGRSWCLMQIKTGDGRTATWNKAKNRFKQWGDPESELVQGWTGQELVTDRKKCIEAGYRIIRASFQMCRSLPVADWLSVYASGQCATEGDGAEKSQARMNTALNWFNAHRPPFSDADILSALDGRIAANP